VVAGTSKPVILPTAVTASKIVSSDSLSYTARIGGVIYRNVACPISVNSKCVIDVSRDSTSGRLGVTLQLRREDGSPIATVSNNLVTNFDPSVFHLAQGLNRSALLEIATGRVWYEIISAPGYGVWELDLSCILYVESGYPIFLHPDRTKFGIANNNSPPRVSRLTLSADIGNKGVGILLTDGAAYLLAIAIENFATGVQVQLQSK
jgi:hypothetical protein